MVKSNRGISIIESMVCMVVIGIGFIAIMQLSAFSINSMDRATEKNKLNYLSEMVMEDMIGDPDNVTRYGSFNETCLIVLTMVQIPIKKCKTNGEINLKKKIKLE